MFALLVEYVSESWGRTLAASLRGKYAAGQDAVRVYQANERSLQRSTSTSLWKSVYLCLLLRRSNESCSISYLYVVLIICSKFNLILACKEISDSNLRRRGISLTRKQLFSRSLVSLSVFDCLRVRNAVVCVTSGLLFLLGMRGEQQMSIPRHGMQCLTCECVRNSFCFHRRLFKLSVITMLLFHRERRYSGFLSVRYLSVPPLSREEVEEVFLLILLTLFLLLLCL